MTFEIAFSSLLYNTASRGGSISLYTLPGHGLRLAGECQPRLAGVRSLQIRQACKCLSDTHCSIMSPLPDCYNIMLALPDWYNIMSAPPD